MSRIATIILNRNLPEPTDRLYEHLSQHDENLTDIFVLEAGSEPANLSKYCTWHAKEPEIIRYGLRYCRGMNYALLNLYQEKRWREYDAFFLLTNDTELNQCETIAPLLSVLDDHKRVGILSPCSKRWGEQLLLKDRSTKYFWFIHNHALLLRREFVESIMETREPNFMNFMFDGTNFRGYLSESELIAKAYANDWAAAITTKVFAEENESYLLEKADLILTEGFEENLRLYTEEGREWLRRKYGFNSRWSMQQYVKLFYDSFFEFHPECNKYRI
ncbi:MAG: hypothetical protein ISR95_07375 [Candidatus Marinimicrobia bacterium]|nr:hypothetical protein [Candidatus Neomarinimicrobiota bacterium]